MIYKAFDEKTGEWIYSDKVETLETAGNDDWWFSHVLGTFCIVETHERFYEQNGQIETIREYREVKAV